MQMVLNGRENVAYERAKRYIERGYSFETWLRDVDIPSRKRALDIWHMLICAECDEKSKHSESVPGVVRV